MADFTEKIVDVLIAVVIFFALIPVIITATTGSTWSAMNVGGTVYNLSWVPFVLVILILAGGITLVARYMKSKK